MKIELKLSEKMTKANYAAMKAEITQTADNIDIVTRVASAPWKVKLTAPTFNQDGTIATPPYVEVTVPSDVQEDDVVLLKVTLIDSDGAEVSATRALYYSTKITVSGVKLDKTTLTLTGTNDIKKLTATVLPADAANKNVTWTSSDPKVATVDQEGKVISVDEGTAEITVTTEQGSYTATCEVTVEKIAINQVKFEQATATAYIGRKLPLVVTFEPKNATGQTGTWESDNEAVATVDENGGVTGVTEGTAKITFTTTDATKYVSCEVTVKPLPTDYLWYRIPIKEKTYEVKTRQDLFEFAKMVNKDATLPTDLKDGDDFNGKTVIMGDDIDLGNKTWSPIGIYPTPGTQDESRSFSGTFDGNGKQIEGLSINITEYKVGIGLFGYTHDATIQNLTVRSGSVTGYDCVGAIVGRASSSITIVHCVNWASVNAWGVSGGSSAGGIVGGTDSYSTFIACENYGAINARGDGAGGIHGDALRDAPSPNFIACINHGNISSGFYACLLYTSPSPRDRG